MRWVTGGGAPAEIWKNFMTQALPRLRAQPIPGGAPPPPQGPDPIGDLLGAVGIGGDAESPVPPAQPPPPTQPQDLPY
jgi:penicillin-binding protein 1A